MAVRPLHVNEGGIVERRLRPIYDWLDNGNNKKALQEAEKVLKKAPSLQAAKALKALALFRLGRGPEGQSILDTLAEMKPSDDSTLQAMTICYRESQQLEKVCSLFEAAVNVVPLSEELHSHLFMSYVRIGDYKAQQRTAMALYKFAPKNPYYFWAVMSIVLQGKAASDSKQKGILLALAQRMIENFITDNKMEAEQEARLYIMVLELQEKWEDIIKFLDSPLYAQLIPGSNYQACIPYLKRLGHWRRLNIICKELLLDNQDRWDYYMPYFDSVFALMNEEKGEDAAIDDSPEKCHESICQIIESVAGKPLRGPFLARLELWKRLSVEGDAESLLGSGVALLLQYLRVFAHKPCAVPDLRPYLSMIPQKEREEKCRDFLTCLGFDENSEPESTNDIQRHISCLSLWRLTAPPPSAEQAVELATLLRAQYLRILARGLLTATLTEFCAADSYGILAAHHYYYAATLEQDPRWLIEALSLLELVLHNSPSNFHAKLLLVKLYHMIGSALAADTIYQKLEIKHIQLVSLGWVHADRLIPGCAFSKALQLLADTTAFHTHHAKESVEQVTHAYKYGTFEKVCEVGAWARRVRACAGAAAARTHRHLAALVAGPPARPVVGEGRGELTDNRDLNVFINFDPTEDVSVTRKQSFEQDVAFIKLKEMLLIAVAQCAGEGEAPSMEEFQAEMDKYRHMYPRSEEARHVAVSAPFPSRIIAFVNSPVPYWELYPAIIEAAWCECLGRAAGGLWARAAGLLRDGPRWEGDGGWGYRGALEELANYMEFIGVAIYLLGVCYEYMTPTNTKKSKKKTNQSPEEIKTIESLTEVNEVLQQNITTIETKILDKLPKQDYVSTLKQELSKLNICKNYACPVDSKIKNAREEMISELRNILKKKVKYLKSLIH